MQVGVSTASLFTRMNNEDAVAYLDSLGIKTAEIFLTSFCEYEESFARQLQQRKGKLFINSVHILTAQVEPQIFSAHAKVKGDAYALLDKVCKSANILGAPYYTFHGTSRYKISARNPENDNFVKMGNSLLEAVEFCDKRGVTLCLENVEWSTYNRIGVFHEMTRYIPNLKGVLDIKQARLSGVSYAEYIKEMQDKIAYVHISDIDKTGKMCLPGQGTFDFKVLLNRLADVGFDGALLIEAYNGDYKNSQELKTATDYVEELLYKYNYTK